MLGVDPADGGLDWHARVGIVLQECRMEPKLTVRETLEMFAGYYANARDVTETIELVGLGEKADERAGKLSGGQQRRLDVGVALVGDAELLFLDEPTTGFDPSARRHFWDVISGLRELGKTVFLTTHYMDEAQALADRVAVIRAGEIVATGTPDDLGGRGEAASVISFALPAGAGAGRAARRPRAPPRAAPTARSRSRRPTRSPPSTRSPAGRSSAASRSTRSRSGGRASRTSTWS